MVYKQENYLLQIMVYKQTSGKNHLLHKHVSSTCKSCFLFKYDYLNLKISILMLIFHRIFLQIKSYPWPYNWYMLGNSIKVWQYDSLGLFRRKMISFSETFSMTLQISGWDTDLSFFINVTLLNQGWLNEEMRYFSSCLFDF